MAQTKNRKLPRFVPVLVTTCCSLLIAACAAPERAQAQAQVQAPAPAPAQTRPPAGCVGVNCFVNIMVDALDCTVSADPPGTLSVPKANPATHHIKWTIQTDGYKFMDPGIVINGYGFKVVQPASGKIFMVDDDHMDVHRPIKYTVFVVRDSDKKVCWSDPYIYNE